MQLIIFFSDIKTVNGYTLDFGVGHTDAFMGKQGEDAIRIHGMEGQAAFAYSSNASNAFDIGILIRKLADAGIDVNRLSTGKTTPIHLHGFLIKKDRFPKNRIFRLKNILK